MISENDIFFFLPDISLRWMLKHLIDDKSALFHVMAWCH